MASPLDYNTQYLHYWSSDPCDILFGAQYKSLSFLGISICHPIYDDKALTSALRHAIYSDINTEATATFMFLPLNLRWCTSIPLGQICLCFILGGCHWHTRSLLDTLA
eukprot:62941-Pelagomonas_calceolata.AAC.1